MRDSPIIPAVIYSASSTLRVVDEDLPLYVYVDFSGSDLFFPPTPF